MQLRLHEHHDCVKKNKVLGYLWNAKIDTVYVC